MTCYLTYPSVTSLWVSPSRQVISCFNKQKFSIRVNNPVFIQQIVKTIKQYKLLNKI